MSASEPDPGTAPEDLLRVAVTVADSEREQAVATLLGISPEGFDEIDRDGEVELGVYTDAAGLAQLSELFARVAALPVEPGWEDSWKTFHRAVRAGELWITPPWIDAPPGAPAVVIDPGRAFGTGAHPTTQLCLELLAGCPVGSVLDVGCGSGVLAIAARRLGFGPVLAVDNDPVAVEATEANAVANGVDLDVRTVDALAEPLPPADVALANVLLAPVERILARLDVRVAVTSGYLAGEIPAHGGWRHVETRTLDGWAADRFERDDDGPA